jgi:hypothetical protein
MGILEDFEVPGNLINLIWHMYSNTYFTIDGTRYTKSSNGIPQGSTMSPLLFDQYIDSLIKELEGDGTMVRAYADDIVLVLENPTIMNDKLKIILDWSKDFSININPDKSSIIRLLKRKGKILGVQNLLNIKEVANCKYLVVWFD